MLFSEIIRRKRDGETLSDAELTCFVRGLAEGSVPAEQVSALAMAMYLNGLSFHETATLTREMAGSGVQLDWHGLNLPGPVVDKHSTGGIGDKVSFLLAPLAAACGCYVPMISGRGLGHSGGTLDKIESIPGYQSMPELSTLKQVVKEVGCAIIGQTDELAPADRRLYAIRDTTATVESIPLITASILSKKIAAGNRSLVMDVKCGNGAFMTRLEDAKALAHSIIETARLADLNTHALITDMNECLGKTAGNALEVGECIEFLRGENQEPRLKEVTLALTAQMLIVTNLEPDPQLAIRQVNQALESGRGAEVFGRMVAALGGPTDLLEQPDVYLPEALISEDVFPLQPGYVTQVAARELGNLIIQLKGGRRRLDDALDLSVGLSQLAPIGAWVDGQRPLGVVHAGCSQDCQHAALALREAYVIAEAEPEQPPVIREILASRNHNNNR